MSRPAVTPANVRVAFPDALLLAWVEDVPRSFDPDRPNPADFAICLFGDVPIAFAVGWADGRFRGSLQSLVDRAQARGMGVLLHRNNGHTAQRLQLWQALADEPEAVTILTRLGLWNPPAGVTL